MTTNLPDESERLEALDVDHSWAVSAPAGSGKTQLLTHRVLKLLSRVKQPEEVLAITFTRKAAAEMRDRILHTLIDAASGQPDLPPLSRKLALAVLARDRKLGWSLVENPGRLKIQTIDSFCMHLVRRMPLTSRMGAAASIADDPHSLYLTAILGFISRAHQPEIKSAWTVLLSQMDNQAARIESLLQNLLANREQWLPWLVGHGENPDRLRLQLEHNLGSVIEESLQDTREALLPWSGQLLPVLGYAADQIVSCKPDSPIALLRDIQELPGCEIQELPLWYGLLDILITKSGKWRVRLTKNEGFPAPRRSAKSTADESRELKSKALALINSMAQQGELLVALQQLRCLPSPRYGDSQWQLLKALMQILPRLVAELTLVFQEQGQVDYAQVSIAARASLGRFSETTDLALKLDYQINHILVDEFQDTSSAQFDLLQKLTEGWQPGDGRSFFIVGDAMQSCYGFRNANVGLFLAARQFGIGSATMNSLDLKTNFRSCQGLVEWVNHTFSQAFPVQADISRGAVNYSNSWAIKEDLPGQQVEFYICDNDSKRVQEAAQVVYLVKKIQQQSPEDSIAILVRNRSHLQTIIPALQQAGLSWNSVDLDPLAKKPAVTDLFNLLRALLDLTDRLAWLSLLRAPWCGLTLADLLVVAEEHGKDSRISIWNRIKQDQLMACLSNDGKIRLTNMKVVLERAIYHRCRQPLREWLEGVWLQLGGPATLVADAEHLEVQAFLNLLEQHQTAGGLKNLTDFIRALHRLYAPASSEKEYNLHIMTIHKAKGLEFDHVLLPGLDRKPASNAQELLLWHERVARCGDAQLILAPISARSDEQNLIYQYVKSEQSIKEKLESLRLIYVATTRAIKGLTLLGCLKKADGSGEFTAPSSGSLLHPVWPIIQTQAHIVDNKPPAQETVERPLPGLYRLINSQKPACSGIGDK